MLYQGGECPDEDDFAAMHAALGDAEAQEAVRAANPERRHCELLLVDSAACETCPKNPRHAASDQDESPPEARAAWMRASELTAMLDAGLTLSPRDVTAVEFELLLGARIARQRRDAEVAKVESHGEKLRPPADEERRRRADMLARVRRRARSKI